MVYKYIYNCTKNYCVHFFKAILKIFYNNHSQNTICWIKISIVYFSKFEMIDLLFLSELNNNTIFKHWQQELTLYEKLLAIYFLKFKVSFFICLKNKFIHFFNEWVWGVKLWLDYFSPKCHFFEYISVFHSRTEPNNKGGRNLWLSQIKKTFFCSARQLLT